LGSPERFHSIQGDELYTRLATGEPVVVLDVRTEEEFADRHIPGSVLIPLHELESRIGEVPNSGVPVAVVSRRGNRGVSACRLLAEHGLSPLMKLEGGLDAWPGPVSTGGSPNGLHAHGIAPSSFLVENFDLLPRGLALDIAMGQGRNAIYLATRGFDVDGVDVDPRAVARARAAARRLGAPIRAVVGNVEDGTYIIPIETYDVIVVFNYLHRPLFNDIREGLKPGGVVVYQTFTTKQACYGHPTNPDHLLRPGELREMFQDWEILRYREVTGRSRSSGSPSAVASIVARKPATGKPPKR
jgi:rhodanese-related sulfurtransferase